MIMGLLILMIATLNTHIISEQDLIYAPNLFLGQVFEQIPYTYCLSRYGFMPEINIRGMERPIYMINGEPVELVKMGSRFIDLLPIDIVDIQRIEIIKMPQIFEGYSLTGGAINIITKNETSARSEPSRFTTRVFAGSETGDPLIYEYIAPLDSFPNKERIGPTGAISLGFKKGGISGASERYCTLSEINEFTRKKISPENFYEWTYRTSINGQFNYGKIKAFGGIKDFKGWSFIPDVFMDMLLYSRTGFVTLDIPTGRFLSRASFLNSSWTMRETSITKEGKMSTNILNLTTKFKNKNFMIGANLSNMRIDNQDVLSKEEAHLVEDKLTGGLFFETKINFLKLNSRLYYREKFYLDYSLLLFPGSDLTLSFSSLHSFPDFFESYADLKIRENFGIRGCNNTEPEQINWLELSWANICLYKVWIKNGIYNDITDFEFDEDIQQNLYLTEYKRKDLDFWGMEIREEINPFQWLKLSYNFSVQSKAPRRKANLSFLILRDFYTSGLIHYLNDTDWDELGILPSYTTLDLKVGKYFFNNRVNISILGTNILDKKYKIHPLGPDIGFKVFLNIWARLV